MKFTLSWLKDYLQTDADLPTVLEAMTMAGLEVEHVDNPAETLADFSIAKVTAADQHPDADKLRVCTVETKDGTKQIVCGAPNARAGMTAVYAGLGTYIPGLDFSLDKKPRKIRGVESFGMMCSAKELELGEDHDGILDLQGEYEVGQPAADALGLNDPVIDFEVTPNRPDWLGVIGIARDLAAAGVGVFADTASPKVQGDYPCPIEIKIEAPDACPVFSGRLIRGVKNGPSPDWLQARLKAIGINPKNMLVDVTNYISFDRARPLHVYDAAKLQGVVVARLGVPGDRFEALDGEIYEPTADMCVIADDSGAIGFGGVMGGESTGVSDDTTDVFIESAWFDPLRTARTGRTTGILSDARYRFERGVDPQSCVDGLDRATRLILDACGGEPSDVFVAGDEPDAQAPIDFKPKDMARLTGVDLPAPRMKDILATLGFETPKSAELTDEIWKIGAPSFRRDMAQSADIVEELIRIEGFDALPADSLPRPEGPAKLVTTPLQNRVRIARRVMASRGFLEAVTWSFMSKDKAALFVGGANALHSGLFVDNPIASDLDYMRPSILANLAEAAQRNADHGAGEVRLFEAGPVYRGDGPKEQASIVSALVRPKPARHWAGALRPYDAFAAKADAFALLEALGQPADRFQIGEIDAGYWHPGRSATLRMGPKNIVARFGELHPATLKALDVEGPIVAFELDLGALPTPKAKGGKTKPTLNKADLTPIVRDFAFETEDATPAGEIARLAGAADKALITDARVFDVYRGKGVEGGRKSVAIEVTLQPRGEALTDKDIDAVADKIVKAVAKGVGARLRA